MWEGIAAVAWWDQSWAVMEREPGTNESDIGQVNTNEYSFENIELNQGCDWALVGSVRVCVCACRCVPK